MTAREDPRRPLPPSLAAAVGLQLGVAQAVAGPERMWLYVYVMWYRAACLAYLAVLASRDPRRRVVIVIRSF